MKQGRPLGFDPGEVLEAAMRLFWRKGYDLIIVEDLLKVTKISKSCFYHTYGNKYNLLDQALNYYCAQRVALLERLLQQTRNGRVFIENFFQDMILALRLNEPHLGFFIFNNSSDSSNFKLRKLQKTLNLNQRFFNVLCDAIVQGQMKKTIATEKKPEALAHYLMSSLAGIQVMTSAGVHLNQLQKIIDEVLTTLDNSSKSD